MAKITSVRQNTNNSIFFLEIKRVHKIHINVTINTFFISNMTKITAVRQNTNSSIFIFQNQK